MVLLKRLVRLGWFTSLAAVGLHGPWCSVRAADVGEAVMVRSSVTGTLAGAAPRALAVGDGIALGLGVATGPASGIRMTFDPQGALTLGPETRLTIEQRVVDQATGRGTSKLAMAAGKLRVTLGRLFGGNVEVTTPTAVIGIKGTDVFIEVDPDTGATTVMVLEASGPPVDVLPLSGGPSVPIPAGKTFQISVSGPGGVPQQSAGETSAWLLDQPWFGALLVPPAPGTGAPGQGPGKGATGATLTQKAGAARLVAQTNSPSAGQQGFIGPGVGVFPESPALVSQRNPNGGCLLPICN